MSTFWDRIKPSTPAPQVVDLQVAKDQRSVRLVWEDGKQSTLPARALRQSCPCAACVDEWTNKKLLDPSSVPEDLAIAALQPVGNYAVQFQFSDGHSTGIYDWAHLREIAEKNPA